MNRTQHNPTQHPNATQRPCNPYIYGVPSQSTPAQPSQMMQSRHSTNTCLPSSRMRQVARSSSLLGQSSSTRAGPLSPGGPPLQFWSCTWTSWPGWGWSGSCRPEVFMAAPLYPPPSWSTPRHPELNVGARAQACCCSARPHPRCLAGPASTGPR